MAARQSTPAELKEALSLIKQLKKGYTDLGQTTEEVFAVNSDNLKDQIIQAGGVRSALEKWTLELDKVEDSLETAGKSAKSIYQQFNNIVGELKKTNQNINLGSKSMSVFQQTAEKLKNDQQGITRLSKTELETLQKKNTQAVSNLNIANQALELQITNQELVGDELIKAQALIDERKEEATAIKDLIKLTDDRLKKEEEIEKTLGIAPKLLEGLKKIPIIGDVLDIKGAQTAMIEAAEGGASGFKSMGAGVKALGPSLKAALGPLALISVAVDVFKFFFNAALKADEQITNIAKSLNVSKDRASDVRQSFFDIKNSAGSLAQIQEGNLILVENLVKTQIELNDALGLSVDLTEEQNTKFLTQLTNANKFLKLEKDETEGLIALFAQTGEEVEDIKNLILGTTKETKLLTGFQVNERKILGDVLKTSNSIKLSIKGGTEALIQSTINANKFGTSLKDLSSTSSALLNFEQSISDELNAELLLGRDINLDAARQAALTNDQLGLTNEIGKLVAGFGPDFQKNALAQEAFAKTLGKSKEEIADMYTKYLETEKLRNNQLKLGEAEIAQIKEKTTITTDQLALLEAGELSGVEFYDILKESGIQSERLTELLAGLSVTSLESQSAQEKFNDAIASAQESFTRFVTGGTLDKFANLLTQFINVWQSRGIIAAVMSTGGADATKEAEKSLLSGREGAEAKKAYIIAEQAERGEGSGVNYTRDVGGGMAEGGIVPAGFPNDSYSARLSSNEAVIPLDQLMVKFDAMTAAIASNRQSAPNIYLENTKLNSATAMGSYELNKGTTGSGR